MNNLGSIQLNAAYHHLNNWGTNSLFVVIGEKFQVPEYDESGFKGMRTKLKLGITLEERIADGYYYSRDVYKRQAGRRGRARTTCGPSSGGTRTARSTPRATSSATNGAAAASRIFTGRSTKGACRHG